MSYGPHSNDFLFTECKAPMPYNPTSPFIPLINPSRRLLPRHQRLRNPLPRRDNPAGPERLKTRRARVPPILRVRLPFTYLSPHTTNEAITKHRNYQLTSEGVCYRTEIAAGLTYMPLRLWQDYVLGYSTDGVDEKMSAAVIRGWIGVYIKEADEAVARLEDLYIAQTEDQGVIRMLLKRWRQIRALCEEAIDRVSS